MKLTKRIANFAGAAAIALGAAAMDAQAGNTPPGYGNNPTPTPGCNGNPNCGGGGHHTPTPPAPIHNHGGIGIGKGGMGGQGGMGGMGGMGGLGGAGGAGGLGGVATSNANSNANANANNTGVNNSVNFPRMVGNAPAAIAYANGNCQTGFGISAGTFVLTGGVSFTQTDYKCMDYQMAATLGIHGMNLGRNEVVLMSLATLNNLSPNIRLATQQVANGYLHCGRRAMESNLIVGTAIAVNGGPCPGGAPRGLAHHYNGRAHAPRVVHKQNMYECTQVLAKQQACIAKYPALAKQ